MPPTEVAPGIYRCGSDIVNWYLLDAPEGVVVIDAGLPAHWSELQETLAALGAGVDDVAALLLTHGHPDHVGFAEALQERGVPVCLHPADAERAEDGNDGPGLRYLLNLWRPSVLRFTLAMIREGANGRTQVSDTRPLSADRELAVPGSPRVLHLPGHTPGSCAFWFPDRGALCTGDALGTGRGRSGGDPEPGLHEIFDRDHEAARRSLDRIADLGHVVLLPGHGDPWEGEASDAVRIARSA